MTSLQLFSFNLHLHLTKVLCMMLLRYCDKFASFLLVTMVQLHHQQSEKGLVEVASCEKMQDRLEMVCDLWDDLGKRLNRSGLIRSIGLYIEQQ